MIHPRIAARILNAPLMVHPGKAAAILSGLGGRVLGNEIDVSGVDLVDHVAFAGGRPHAGTIGDRLGRRFERRGEKPYDMLGSIALIPIEGSLVHKGAWVESDSGETSYQGIQTQVSRAMRDLSVSAVAFEVDSYGGEVSGAFETADMIAELSAAKPTIAILSDHAYSAGYLMAAATRFITVPEAGGVGSIGVITMHTDMSAALANAGIKVTILTAGAHKADANPVEPLPEGVADRIRADLEAMRGIFAGRVAQYRAGRISLDQILATEARVYSGAEGVKAGLADATVHPSQMFAAFFQKYNRA
jgi:ClpP class serine protease